jgi:hypothetical protein
MEKCGVRSRHSRILPKHPHILIRIDNVYVLMGIKILHDLPKGTLRHPALRRDKHDIFLVRIHSGKRKIAAAVLHIHNLKRGIGFLFCT